MIGSFDSFYVSKQQRAESLLRFFRPLLYLCVGMSLLEEFYYHRNALAAAYTCAGKSYALALLF